MKHYLEERLHELRQRYKDTGDSKWLHRFNECHHIREKLYVDEIASTQAAERNQGRHTTSPSTGDTSPHSHRRLD